MRKLRNFSNMTILLILYVVNPYGRVLYADGMQEVPDIYFSSVAVSDA